MYTILLIDEEISLLNLLQMILQRAGYRTLSTNSALDGMHMVHKYHPDLIIVDETMEEYSGSDLCMVVKSEASTAHIPVIIHSGGSKVYDQRYLDRIGAAAGLPKPSSLTTILAVIKDCLSAKV
jgi:DNA-binding response OmpR family regulator